MDDARFESLLDGMEPAVVVSDPTGVMRFVNGKTSLLFGYEGEDLVGRPIDTLVPESSRQVHRAPGKGAFAHPETRVTGAGEGPPGRRRDGSKFPADMVLSSIDTEDGTLVLVAVYDVTERTRAIHDLNGGTDVAHDVTDPTDEG